MNDTTSADDTGTEPVLVTEQQGAVRVLRLNRPEARNALNPELLTAIGLAMVEAENDPEIAGRRAHRYRGQGLLRRHGPAGLRRGGRGGRQP